MDELIYRDAPREPTAKQAYKEHKRFLADPGWRTVEYTRAPGISCHELPTRVERIGDEEQPVYAVMASGVVEGKTADSIARAHLDSNKCTRLAWDHELSDIGRLEEVQRDDSRGMSLTVDYAVNRTRVPGVAQREFVFLQWAHAKPSAKHRSDHDWTILARHTDHPRRPVQSSPVRALSHSIMILDTLTPDRSGLLEQPRTNVTIAAWIVPGGWLPTNVVSLYKTVLADRIRFLRDVNFS